MLGVSVVVVVVVVFVVVDIGRMFGSKVTVGGSVVVVVVVVEIDDNVVGVIAVSVTGELAHGGLMAELTTSDDTCGSLR